MSTYDTEQLGRLEPAYLANYGLTQAPFSNQHDDRFLYLDAERAQRLNLLQHMTQYSNLLLIVQGEKGVGKTSLLTRFVNTKADNWHICQVTSNTFMDAGQLLFLVAQGFGLEQMPHDSGELQEMLYARIATYHHNDQTPILLIDDAHELPKDALLAIFHLADTQVDNANLVRIILFAEPQIERILSARDVRTLRERITHTMLIPPLDEDTTAEYLKHRMAVAGFSGGSPFTPKMVKRIYKASGGIPARINQLAHETLDKGDFEREDVEEIVKPAQTRRQYKTGTLIAIGVILLALVLVFQHRINRLFQDKSSQTTTMSLPLVDKTPEIHPQPSIKPPATTATSPAASPPAQALSSAEKPQLHEKVIPLHPAAAKPVQSPPASSPGAATDTDQATISANKTSQAPVLHEKPPPSKPAPAPKKPAVAAQQIHVAAVEPSPVPASDQPQTIRVRGEGFTANSRVFVRWTNKDHEIPPPRVKLISDKQLQVRLTVGTRHDKWQLHVEDPGRGDSNILKFNVDTASLHSDTSRDWILGQKPGMYTLQLFGSLEQKNAEAFIRQHRLGQEAHYFASVHKGRRWYSVVYGAFPDRAAAHAAIKTLPMSLHKIKPWIRRFGDIQASLHAPHAPRKRTQPAATKPKPRPSLPASAVFTTPLPKHASIEQYASWLWSQDPGYFTLQLLGVRELASVKKFLKRYPELAGTTAYFRTRHQGHDWYAVVYGVYPDKQKARAAIKRLPPRVQKASPWIRSFAGIQADLSRTK